jgi:hypothetical protein
MTKHKWADVIHAWADGAEVEFRMINANTGQFEPWKRVREEFFWLEGPGFEYRIAPAKPVIIPDGWVCVPQKLTNEMALEIMRNPWKNSDDAWKCILDARPSLPKEE